MFCFDFGLYSQTVQVQCPVACDVCPDATTTEAPREPTTAPPVTTDAAVTVPADSCTVVVEVMNQNMYCSRWSAAGMGYYGTVQECAAVVLEECENNRYFNYRYTNGACHCLNVAGDCADDLNPKTGMDLIYTVSHDCDDLPSLSCALELNVEHEDMYCGDFEKIGVVGNESECAVMVLDNCNTNTEYFAFWRDSGACHCLTEPGNCADNLYAKMNLDVWKIEFEC